MSDTLLTVAVATCGRPESLERCLEALAAGRSVPDEIIVVDQAETVAARRLVEGLDRIPHRYLPQRRLGLSASRNLALDLCRHDILAVTDDDCVPDLGWVEAIRCSLQLDPAPDVLTGPVLPTRDPGPGEYIISHRAVTPRIDHDARRPPWELGTGGNFVARTAILRSIGGWDERLGVGSAGRAAEDIELLDRLQRNDFRIRFEPDMIVRHQLGDRAKRLSTRWTYGFGIGALIGMRSRARDRFATTITLAYLRLQVRPLLRAVIERDAFVAQLHVRSLAAVVPGIWYGVQIGTERGAVSDGSDHER